MGLISSTDNRTLLGLVQEASRLWSLQPSELVLPSDRPIVVVSDNHADYETLDYVLGKFPFYAILFNGDMIDRKYRKGNSLRAISTVMEAQCDEPDRVYALRGDHEFEEIFGGIARFSVELAQMNKQHLSDAFSAAFPQLPYAARTANGVYVVHGGLPKLASATDMLAIPKGVVKLDEHLIVTQAMFSDRVFPSHPYWKEFQRHVRPDGTAPNYSRHRPNEKGEYIPEEKMALLYADNHERTMLGILGAQVVVRGHDPDGLGAHGRSVTIHTCRSFTDIPTQVAIIDPQKTICDARDIELVDL